MNNRTCLFSRILSTDNTTDDLPSVPTGTPSELRSTPDQSIAADHNDHNVEKVFVKTSESLESDYRSDDVIKNQVWVARNQI